jgi:hypothetical protein
MNIPNKPEHKTLDETAKMASPLECAYDLCRIIVVHDQRRARERLG